MWIKRGNVAFRVDLINKIYWAKNHYETHYLCIIGSLNIEERISFSSEELYQFVFEEFLKSVMEGKESINFSEIESRFVPSAVSFEEFQKLEGK